jgi:hypothetical protein
MARKTQNLGGDRTAGVRTLVASGDEAVMAGLIHDGIKTAESQGRVIDEATARRIAACLHRGLGGELERLAGTGQLDNPQVAREELFYSASGERRFAGWRVALLGFIRQAAKSGKGQGPGRRWGQDTAAANRADEAAGASVGAMRSRQATPVPVAPLIPACHQAEDNPAAAVIYVAVEPGDRVRQPALALHMQHQACRDYVRRQLRKRVGATFADTAASRHQGLRVLLSHLAICHHQRVVVQRLDRIPDETAWATIHRLGARVLSVSDQAPRGCHRQAGFLAELQQLNTAPGSRRTTLGDPRRGCNEAGGDDQ